ncbi:MAG: alpha/beta fold hydrolase [Rhizomicrobium sp.]
MSVSYRLGFEFASPDDTRSIDDARWSLAALDPATRVFTGSFFASDGADIPYRLWPAAAPRALVVLLHGATDYSGAFDEIGPAFAARGLSALAIDQRGFGATATRGKWGGKDRMIRDAAEAVIYLRKRFGDALPVFLVGESMGAALAVHVAARAPELGLAGVVLAAPGAISGLWRRLFGSALTRVLRFFMPRSGIVIERISAWEFTPGAAIRLLSDPMVLRRVRPATLFGLFELSQSAVDEARRGAHSHADHDRRQGGPAARGLHQAAPQRPRRRQAMGAVQERAAPASALEEPRQGALAGVFLDRPAPDAGSGTV